MPKGIYIRTTNKGWFKKEQTQFNTGRTRFKKGHKGYWSRKKFSRETRKKMTKVKIGENNPNWKGGITPENIKIRNSIEIRLWREAVFARDNWTCQKCKERSSKGIKVYLQPHHIKNFAECIELRTSIENGITFCKKCHSKFHKKYGKKNNTKEQLEEFLND